MKFGTDFDELESVLSADGQLDNKVSILDRADRCVDVTLFLLPLVLLVVCALGAASTDMSKIIVDEEEETKDCFFTTV